MIFSIMCSYKHFLRITKSGFSSIFDPFIVKIEHFTELKRVKKAVEGL